MVTSNPTIQRAGFLAATQASVKFSCPLHRDPLDIRALAPDHPRRELLKRMLSSSQRLRVSGELA